MWPTSQWRKSNGVLCYSTGELQPNKTPSWGNPSGVRSVIHYSSFKGEANSCLLFGVLTTLFSQKPTSPPYPNSILSRLQGIVLMTIPFMSSWSSAVRGSYTIIPAFHLETVLWKGKPESLILLLLYRLWKGLKIICMSLNSEKDKIGPAESYSLCSLLCYTVQGRYHHWRWLDPYDNVSSPSL